MEFHEKNEEITKDGLTIEECKELYFDADALLAQPEPLYRINNYANGRYYYNYDENGEPIFYISVTNMIAQTMPTSPHLIKWIADQGYENADDYKEERADYGTMMHIAFQNLLINKELDLDELDEKVSAYCEVTGNQKNVKEWTEDLKSDVLSFAQWMIDFDVKPIFIELVLGSKEGQYAGAVDLGCYLDMEVKGFFGETYKSGARKGEPKETKMTKRVFGIVDFKSGRKGFYENHEIQLEAYKNLTIENFPQLADEEIFLFNFSPKAWRSAPSYNFKDQTNSPNRKKLPYITELAKIQNAKRSTSFIKKSGKIDFKKDEKSISDNYRSIDFTTLLKSDQS